MVQTVVYRWTPTRVQEMRSLKRQGYTFRELANHYGHLFSREQVQDIWWAMATRENAEACIVANNASDNRSRGVQMVNFNPVLERR